MRELMLGNKAVARGMYEAGCKVISSYPGTPSTEITEEAAKYDEIYCEWAPNEKVALEAAHGATLGGVRAACAMKHVGLNVAADPLFTISYQGLNAGLVICVADDPGMHSSQNEQDSRHYAFAAKVPMLEPADSEESRLFVKEAYEISEKYNTPVFIKMCTRVAHSQSVVCPEERVEPAQVPYVKDPTKVMMTKNSRDAHVRVEQRTLDLIQYAETSGINRIEECAEGSLINGKKIGVITSSTSYQYTKEVFGDKVSVLKLGMVYPLPEKLIKDFAEGKDEIYVIEELDPIIENHCKQLGIQVHGKDTFPICGEFSQNLIKKCIGMEEPEFTSIDAQIPGRPPVMCAGCPHRGVFYTLKKKDSDNDETDFDDETKVPFQIAYAVSIHKAQGLEYDSVKVIITEEVDRMITHNIFYTAITRTRKNLMIYWSPETQERVISKFEIANAKGDASVFAAQAHIKMRKIRT